MPIVLVELLLQVLLATHAVRTGRATPWLWIIIVAPGLGCLLYIAIEILPEFFNGPAGHRVARDIGKTVAPERDYRRLLGLAEDAPTVENKTRLAEECLRLGRNSEAVELYQACAVGLHATDPKILFGLARAQFAVGDFQGVIDALDTLRAHNADYQSSEGHMLYARALEQLGRDSDALVQYAALADYYPGEEARCRYALLLQKTGAVDQALPIFGGIVRNVQRRGGRYRRAEKPWYETARRMLPS